MTSTVRPFMFISHSIAINSYLFQTNLSYVEVCYDTQVQLLLAFPLALCLVMGRLLALALAPF